MNAMFNHGDAFIALPGGLGKLEEIFHISFWAQLHINL
jgi:predicted Rossmann-fold nucleotide-binding protein